MLTQEAISKRIEARRKIKAWIDIRMDGLATLDKASRAIGRLLLGCDEHKGTRHLDSRKHWHARTHGIRRLASLDERALLRLAKKLFPRYTAEFEAAWKLHEQLPYQSDPVRRPFRAASRPDLLRSSRAAFLNGLLHALEGLDEDLPWLAAHATHITEFVGAEYIGLLLAGAIDRGGQQAGHIDAILRQSAEGTHEIGRMGRHVTTAFQCSNNPRCWEYIEKLLLAAQRQEGLRQVILESADLSHPDAFRRMLRLILEQNLTRFSSTVRAADVWLGLQLDSQSARYIHDTLQSVATFLADPQARDRAIRGTDAKSAYFGLWAKAFDDAPGTIAHAATLLKHRKPELRFIGVQMLGMLDIPDVYTHIVSAVDDADVSVSGFAAANAAVILKQRMQEQAAQKSVDQRDPLTWGSLEVVNHPTQLARNPGDLFERLQKLYARLPVKASDAKPLVWPWLKLRKSRQMPAETMVLALEERPVSAVLPYLDAMSPTFRRMVANLLGAPGQADAASRSALLRLVGDAAAGVREAAVKAIKKRKVAATDLIALEALLVRKADTLRRGVTAMILSLEDADVLASASRLLESRNAPQRLAGLELLQQMHAQDRATQEVSHLAAAYRRERKALNRDERAYLDTLGEEQPVAWTLEDALGLMDSSKRTPPTTPRDRHVRMSTPASNQLLQLLDAAVHAHRTEPITPKENIGYQNSRPLGAITFGFPSVFDYQQDAKVARRPLEDLPLREVWWPLWSKRPLTARDKDGLEVARAMLVCPLLSEHRFSRCTGWRRGVLQKLLGKTPRLRYHTVVNDVVEWLAAHNAPRTFADFTMDCFESLLAALPVEKLSEKTPDRSFVFRDFVREFDVLTRAMKTVAEFHGTWTQAHTRRLFGLLRWIDEPTWSAEPAGKAKRIAPDRERPDWEQYAAAFDAGQANEHDLLDGLLGPRPPERYSDELRFDELTQASEDLRKNTLSPRTAAVVQRAVDRVLEIELHRGEADTIATHPALALRYAGGLDTLVRVLQAIGSDPTLRRTQPWSDGGRGKSAVFSDLILATVPGKHDTPETFAQAVAKAGIDKEFLLAVAFYAPQWARFVEAALGWNLLAETVWWFHAHTKDNRWRVDCDLRESWNAQIRKLTPLSMDDLMEGAVDVDWFNRVHATLGDAKWKRLDQYAKYACGGAGHKRAQLFADAMLGKVKKTQLVADIDEKRKQDAVRALGLLPLDKKAGKKDVLERYKAIQEFARTSREFGSQRQASEKLAARIAQENLARTAGYPDPIRLQWAMETLETADLANGPVTVTIKDVSVRLTIDADGRPEVSVFRGDKPLKNIPPDMKHQAAVESLLERKTELRRSASRVRQSLETAMCRGNTFTGEELLELMGNVILRPLLERLVFIGEGILGYPLDGGKGLRDHAHHIEPIKKTEKLRIAHPADLLASKAWSHWQRDCFAVERVQPFKQVFRELYVLTEQETRDSTFSRRYAGHQVNPRQALALLGSRGWVTAPESGVFRAFHDEKLVAWIEFMEAFHTPAEVEGLTIEKVRFARRSAEEPLALKDVPPRVLSETLRDVDLIVSVAHRGGVDPEASASTTAMRSALLRETVRLLKLDNVRIADPLVHIQGTYAEYSVHLGSATAHMLPGGALVIVPVGSQHRGRVFLPFADDDPKTAELLSKVLLLARDQDIKDPNLLDQIRSRG